MRLKVKSSLLLKQIRAFFFLPSPQLRQIFLSVLVLGVVALLYAHHIRDTLHTQFGGNITGFAFISHNHPAEGIWNERTLVRPDDGYDGMFYYYISFDPLIQGDVHKYIDFPAYRYQRIVYPFLVSLLSFGNDDRKPAVMILINYFSVLIGSFGIILIARHFSISPLIAFLYALMPGLWLALGRDLTEPLQLCFLVWGFFYFFCRRNILSASLLFALSSLTKDTSLLIPCLLAGYAFVFERDMKKTLLLTLPLVLYAGWQCYVWAHLGEFPLVQGLNLKETGEGSGRKNFSAIPLSAAWYWLHQKYALYLESGGNAHFWKWDIRIALVGVLAIVTALVRGVLLCFSSKEDRPYGILLLSMGGFFLFLGDSWGDLYGYARTLLPLFLLLLLDFIRTKNFFSFLPLALWSICFFPVTV